MKYSDEFLKYILPRIARGIKKDPDTGCWIWTRNMSSRHGIPRKAHIQINQCIIGGETHRRRHYVVAGIVWQLVKKEPVPEGHSLRRLETCKNPYRCVSPYHQRLIRENREDSFSKAEKIDRIKKELGLKVVIHLDTGCWGLSSELIRWMGSKLWRGEKRTDGFQKAVWLAFRGELPPEAIVAAMCGTEKCLNPAHLYCRYTHKEVHAVGREDPDFGNGE